ncbi:MAG: TetR/AcrR family transcriptional regulator [Pseudomonadaceae bacterium]|nr:TetR/AcrR family transcriptional regulator [Pseudomonadaceae bacterium]
MALFSEHGYKAVTMDDICAAADVAPGTLFHYFGTKAGVLVEFDRRIVVEIEQSLPTTKTDAASRLSVIQVSMSKAWNQAHPSLRALGVDYLRNTRVSEKGHMEADIQDLV